MISRKEDYGSEEDYEASDQNQKAENQASGRMKLRQRKQTK
jgi:hypothetical protein